MNILAVDTAGKTAGVALLQDDRLLYEVYLDGGMTHSETLMPMIDTCLKMCGLTCADIDLYAVNAGPGSFTGLRIGLAAVKGLAFPRETLCAPVSTLEALAAAHTGAAEQQCLLALTAHHCVAGGHSHIGVVHAVGAVGAKVDILQTKLLQMCLDSLFQFKSAVVGGKCDGFCHGKTSFPCEWSQFRFYCLFAAASAARRSARSRSA